MAGPRITIICRYDDEDEFGFLARSAEAQSEKPIILGIDVRPDGPSHAGSPAADLNAALTRVSTPYVAFTLPDVEFTDPDALRTLTDQLASIDGPAILGVMGALESDGASHVLTNITCGKGASTYRPGSRVTDADGRESAGTLPCQTVDACFFACPTASLVQHPFDESLPPEVPYAEELCLRAASLGWQVMVSGITLWYKSGPRLTRSYEDGLHALADACRGEVASIATARAFTCTDPWEELRRERAAHARELAGERARYEALDVSAARTWAELEELRGSKAQRLATKAYDLRDALARLRPASRTGRASERELKLAGDSVTIHQPTSAKAAFTGDKAILLLTHELTRTGAPWVLKLLAGLLGPYASGVTVVSAIDGPLRRDFTDAGAQVVIDPSLTTGAWVLADYARGFDLVIANTIVCAQAVGQLGGCDVPVIWWIHEGAAAFGVHAHLIPDQLGANVRVHAVSGYTRGFCERHGLICEGILPYGIPDADVPTSPACAGDVTHFMLIGSIEAGRKGHDTLLQALKLIPHGYRQRMRVTIIGGAVDRAMTDEVLYAAQKYPFVTYRPPIEHDEVMRMMGTCDCVLVPSRDDPAPVVAAEAFMLRRPCAVSDHTGTATFVHDGVDGFVFPAEDARALADVMIFVMDHSPEAARLGNAGRRIYEDHYSLDGLATRVPGLLAAAR